MLLESSTSLCYDNHCSPLLFFPVTIRLVGLTLSNACLFSFILYAFMENGVPVFCWFVGYCRYHKWHIWQTIHVIHRLVDILSSTFSKQGSFWVQKLFQKVKVFSFKKLTQFGMALFTFDVYHENHFHWFWFVQMFEKFIHRIFSLNIGKIFN